MWLSNWTSSSSKQRARQQLQWPAIFDPCQGKKLIPSLSIAKHLHQNLKTNFMLTERICLFFTNFLLVSVSQHNANSIANFRYNAILFHQCNTPAILSISLCLRLPSHRAQPISCLGDPIKPRHSFSHFILINRGEGEGGRRVTIPHLGVIGEIWNISGKVRKYSGKPENEDLFNFFTLILWEKREKFEWIPFFWRIHYTFRNILIPEKC